MHVSRARARVGAVASLGADAPKMPTDTIRGRLVALPDTFEIGLVHDFGLFAVMRMRVASAL